MRSIFGLRLVAFGVSLVGLTLPGCAPPPPPVPAKTVDLKDISLTGLDAFVAAQKGKVVLVDCWAPTCAPCVKAFPHTVALHDKYEMDGLVVVTVCSDPADYRARALKFLKEKNATCVNFFLADPKPPKELDEKYPTDALPALILFDRAGNRAKAFTFAVDERELDAVVGVLLGGS